MQCWNYLAGTLIAEKRVYARVHVYRYHSSRGKDLYACVGANSACKNYSHQCVKIGQRYKGVQNSWRLPEEETSWHA